MRKTLPKKQHYVPKSYLKRFANEKGKTYVFDKNLGKSRPANINDICCETDFYTLPPWNEVKDNFNDNDIPEESELKNVKEIKEYWNQGYLFETQNLAPIDDGYKRIIDKIIRYTDKHKMFPNHLAGDLFMILITQYLRTKQRRQEIINMRNAYESTLKKLNGMDVEDVLYSNKWLKFEQIENLTDQELHKEMHDCLSSCYLIIMKNETNTGFYTTDAPILRTCLSNNFYSGTSFCSHGLELYYPLSPKYCVHLVDSRFLINDEKYSQKFLTDTYGIMLKARVENVTRVNHIAVSTAENVIISRFNQFELIDKIRIDRPRDLEKNGHGVKVDFGPFSDIYKGTKIDRNN
ncbi:hypothetical protein KQ51_01195 [Candidatus Izimaplasma bacterium HR1]|jgi:hypothetical protein|uniref:DUF4238 domain-containing protein n=1 Tax=Candidatus Izimoplasma sp. HR1 TaxID=1541959 RepID=UPI0004F6BE1A|nr:hypothetical protein KQ51_01195 [Candidatus Izimaplasma bacterium HR1]